MILVTFVRFLLQIDSYMASVVGVPFEGRRGLKGVGCKARVQSDKKKEGPREKK